MSTVPIKGSDAIPWVQAHITPWTTNAEMLKLDPTVIASLDSLADLAESRRVALQAAETARSNALLAYNQSVKDMRTLATGQVATIRSTARNSADPTTIYTLAGIPAPADRQPAPAPGKPTEFRAELLEGGGIRMRFKCPNPPRTGPVTYRVERRIGTQAPLVFFMNAKERTFDDETIPAGTAEATYAVTAQTSTRDGNTGYFSVRFGANNQATVVELPSGEAAEKKAG